MAVPYTFANATVSIPLSELDSNFATAITLGNTAIQLGNTVTTLNNMTLANVTVSSGNATFTTANVTNMSSSNVTITGGTIANVTISGSGSNITATNINASNVTVSTDLTLSGGTANGVAYLNGSKVLTTGSALTFDGTNFATTGTASATKLIPTGGAATGNGMYLPASNTLAWSNNGSETMRLDSSGNLGLGVTPSAWAGGVVATQVKGAAIWSSGNDLNLFTNANYSSSGSKYINSSYASAYQQANGAHYWLTAPSGTAGNAISFTQAMTLDASWNLAVGDTATGNYRMRLTGNNSSVAVGISLNDVGTSGRNYTIRSDAGSFIINDATATAERMRIDSSGRVFINSTSSSFNPALGLVFDPTNGPLYNGIVVRTTTNGSGSAMAFLNSSGTGSGSIVINASSTNYNTSSDYRLKENVQPMQNALATVAQLNPVTYTWKADGSDGQGFIAHELQAVVPDCVTGEKDAVDEEGNPVYQGIDTSFLVATLTAAIQELKAELDSTKAEVAALKAK